MEITLSQILALVGRLDDTPGTDAPRERFRSYLQTNVNEIGQVRDYVQECLRFSGEQYNRALQDLVNFIGRFLGFQVFYGRYQGVAGQNNLDGHWESPTKLHIVVETKTTEVYAIRTATLIGYVDSLISEREVPDWEHALGLYVVGRPDREVRQLENQIIGERRMQQLRVISAESLLSLAELMTEYDVSHDDILAVLRPSNPQIDPIVDLMTRLVAQRPAEEPLDKEPPVSPTESGAAKTGEVAYWLTPVKSDEEKTAEDTIRTLADREHVYAFGERTPGRKHLKVGDWICFYSNAKGVVGHAMITTPPEKKKHPKVRHPDKYPWVFGVDRVQLYLNEPVIVDASLRSQLEAFKGKDLEKPWAWFVQANRRLTAHDFQLLTRRHPEE